MVNGGSINQGLINDISHDIKFHETTVEKVLWLKRVLKELMETEFGRDFALIGGSAIVFLYGNMYRLSVDLDMDYIANPELGREGLSEIEDLKDRHSNIVQGISQNLGLNFKRFPEDDKRMLQVELGFKSVYGKTSSIDLDLGYRYCHSVLESEKKIWPILSNLDIDKENLEVQTLSPEELWASQIVSAISGERIDFDGKNYLGSKRKLRHLYDTFYFVTKMLSNLKDINLDLLRRLVILFGATRVKNFEFTRGDIISLYTDEKIKTELYPVLKVDKNPPKLREMQRPIRRFLDRHIFNDWGDTEYRFFEDFENGLFRPEDLFRNDQIAQRLKGMYFYDEILGKVISREDE